MFRERTIVSITFLLFAAGFTAEAQDEEETISGGAADDILPVPPALTAQKLRETADDDFSITVGAGIVGAYHSNVHRSPDDETGSGMLVIGGGARANKRFSSDRQFSVNLGLRAFKYSAAKNADTVSLDLGGEYDQGLSDEFRFRVAGLVGRKTDGVTDVFGNPYTRDYSYTDLGLEGQLIWDPTPDQRISAGPGVMRRTYGDVSGTNSLDWTALRLIARYRLTIAERHFLRVRLEQARQTYTEEPANNVDGTESSNNPDQRYIHRKILLWYTLPLGDHVGWDTKLTYRTKDDQFEDYESYTATKAETQFAVALTTAMHSTFGVGLEQKDYDNIPDEGTGTLEIDRLVFDVGLRYQFRAGLWGTARYSLVSRDTNRDTGSVYRDYDDQIVTIGVVSCF